MKTNIQTAAGIALAFSALLITGTAFAAARITPAQAKAAALKNIPGKATAAKYEFENGHWQYAVTVVGKAAQMYEVEVNAATGKVTDTEKTSAAEEASEAAADKKAAMKTSTVK